MKLYQGPVSCLLHHCLFPLPLCQPQTNSSLSSYQHLRVSVCFNYLTPLSGLITTDSKGGTFRPERGENGGMALQWDKRSPVMSLKSYEVSSPLFHFCMALVFIIFINSKLFIQCLLFFLFLKISFRQDSTYYASGSILVV